MSYVPNPSRPDICMSVTRTFRYQAEEANDSRDGTACVELRSDDGRYSLVVSAEEFTSIPVSD